MILCLTGFMCKRSPAVEVAMCLLSHQPLTVIVVATQNARSSWHQMHR